MKVKNLVIDTNAFVEMIPLWDFGENFYTLQEVIQEIRDRKSLKHIDALPFELHLRNPSPESVKFINDFTKKTGDYISLSLVDIKLLALTYELEKQTGKGTSHLRSEPDAARTTIVASRKPPSSHRLDLPEGFYRPIRKKHSQNVENSEQMFGSDNKVIDEVSENINNLEIDANEDKHIIHTAITTSVISENKASKLLDAILENTSLSQLDASDNTISTLNSLNTESVIKYKESETERYVDANGDLAKENPNLECDSVTLNNENTLILDEEDNFIELTPISDTVKDPDSENDEEEEQYYDVDSGSCPDSSESDEDDDEDTDDDDGEGWITPSNLSNIKKKEEEEDEEVDIDVACMTTDFAMQNTLLHVGMHVIGFNGKLIKNKKTYTLRCHACYKITNKMDKVFCPHCGHKTLQKVSVTIDPDGKQKIWLSTRRPINLRGTKFSLPAPQRGKHAVNPVLVADQRRPHDRPSKKMMQKINPLTQNYIAGARPFTVRDVYSRSSQLGVSNDRKHRGKYYWEQRNPNEAKKNTKSRKKKRA